MTSSCPYHPHPIPIASITYYTILSYPSMITTLAMTPNYSTAAPATIHAGIGVIIAVIHFDENTAFGFKDWLVAC